MSIYHWVQEIVEQFIFYMQKGKQEQIDSSQMTGNWQASFFNQKWQDRDKLLAQLMKNIP